MSQDTAPAASNTEKDAVKEAEENLSSQAQSAPDAADANLPEPPAGSPLEQALRKAHLEAEEEFYSEESSQQADAGSEAAEKEAPPEEAPAAASQDAETPELKEPAPQAAGAADDAAEASDAAAGTKSDEAQDGTADDPAQKDAAQGSDENLPAEAGTKELAEQDSEPEEEVDETDGEGGRMSLMDHLRELRRRLCYMLLAAFIGFIGVWCFVEPVFSILTAPLLEVMPEGSSAIYTTLPEAFFTRMYIAFITGLFAASPLIFYQIWAFISPGLYKEEKKFIVPVAIVSALFFVAGGLFCYYIVFHYAFAFFMSYSTPDFVAMPKISDYLDFVLKLILAFGLVFEMPIFSFFLSRMGVVTAKGMRNFRRYAVLLTFIVAAILTPPDVVSQLLMAFPMLLLYEVSILVAAIFGKKPAPAEGPDDPDGGDDDGSDDGGGQPDALPEPPSDVPPDAPSDASDSGEDAASAKAEAEAGSAQAEADERAGQTEEAAANAAPDAEGDEKSDEPAPAAEEAAEQSAPVQDEEQIEAAAESIRRLHAGSGFPDSKTLEQMREQFSKLTPEECAELRRRIQKEGAANPPQDA